MSAVFKRDMLKTEMTHYASTEKNSQHTFISGHASNGTVGKSVCVCLMYRLPFELTDSAKLLHFTILGGLQTPPAPLNDATA